MSISPADLEANSRDVMARIDRQQAETRNGPVVAMASIIGAFGGVVAAYAGLAPLAH